MSETPAGLTQLIEVNSTMTQIVEGFSLSHAQVLDGSTSFLEALAQQAAESEDIYGVNEGSIDPDTGDYDNEGDDAVLSTWSWFNFAELAVQAGYFSFPLVANLTGRPVDVTGGEGGTSEVQSLSSSGATEGTFTLTYEGETTSGLQYSATSSAVQTALRGLSTIGNGNVTVSGGPANSTAMTITFGGDLANTDVPLIGVDNTGLTGGTHTVTVTTAGNAGEGSSYGIDLWHEDSMNVAPKPMVVKMPSRDNLGAVRTLAVGLYRVQFRPITFEGPTYKDGLKVNYNGRAVMSATDELGQPLTGGKKAAGRVLSIV